MEDTKNNTLFGNRPVSFGIPKEVGLASWSSISLADQTAAQTAPS